MIIDGETWACPGCIRGHRAGACQHHDRPLERIKKKGRPVSQCHHCRSMRQSRSAHVKCDCAKKLREGTWGQESDGKDRCRCFEDGHCACAFKGGRRSKLDTVSRSDSEEGGTTTTQASDDAAFSWEQHTHTLVSPGPLMDMPLLPGPDSADLWGCGITGHSQLPQEQLDHIANPPGNSVPGDCEQGSLFGVSGLRYLEPLFPFVDYHMSQGLPSPLAGLPATTQGTSSNEQPGAACDDWIQNEHSQAQPFGLDDSAWLESLHLLTSRSELPAADAEAGTTGGDMRYDAAPSDG